MFRSVLAVLALVACLAAARAAEVSEDVPFSSLVVVKGVGFDLYHTSLDGLPPVPEGGLTITLHCSIGDDGDLRDCNAVCTCGEAGKAFVPAALKRVAPIRVDAMTRDGKFVIGARTKLDFPIMPSDRYDGAHVDFSRGSRLKFEKEPLGMDLERYYPSMALRREAEAVIDIACVVEDDLSVSCPDIRVLPGAAVDDELTTAFTLGAREIVKIYRVAPTTQDGKSAVGVGFRKRIKFKLAD